MNRPIQETSVSSECVPNISARGRRRRLILGVVWLVITAAVFVLLVNGNASVPAFLVIAPLATYTAIYFFQVKEQTCVLLAARGLREAENGKIGSRMEGEWLAVIQRQARKVWIESIATGVLAGAAAFAFAWLRG